MKYLKRHLEDKFMRMSDFFKVVLVTGARQVGKTTMLKHLSEKSSRTYVSLDNMMTRNLAKTDPVLFFQTYKPPIIIDEIQYAPELFPQIKIICDESEETGLFWITGSQQYSMMKNVQESLAGRIGILNLYSLSSNEKDGINKEEELEFSDQSLHKRLKKSKAKDIHNVFEDIWLGGMPQVLPADNEMRAEYYNAYVNTYLLRDAVELGGISNSILFGDFIVACSALLGQQLNYKTLADTVGISQPTAKEWVRLLQGMGIIYLLKPFSNNELKRLAKSPKLYFMDTGLAAYLSMWPDYETLMKGPSSGHFFENHVVVEILKNISISSIKGKLMYYRDSNKKEIDLVVESGRKNYPLEIKKSANPDSREVKKFKVLEKANLELGNGGIICLCENLIPIDENNSFIPVFVI